MEDPHLIISGGKQKDWSFATTAKEASFEVSSKESFIFEYL